MRGDAFHDRRDKVFIATKFGPMRNPEAGITCIVKFFALITAMLAILVPLSPISADYHLDNQKAVRFDVTRQEQIDEAVRLINDQGRGLWGLVNNAGVFLQVPFIEAKETDFKYLFDVNVFGVFRVTQAFTPMVIESKGRIVNISSISGVLSVGTAGIYAGSKHALEAMTDSLAEELQPFGVHVAAVNPGEFASEIGLT